MTHSQIDHAVATRLCAGNKEALEWLQLGRVWCHLSDDIVDEDLKDGNRQRGAERLCRLGSLSLDLYTHPFFLEHGPALKQAMKTNISNYAMSLKWEDSKVEWQRNFSDWSRHGWLNVCMAVAEICGGYDHMMSLQEEAWTMAFADHHQDGKAI